MANYIGEQLGNYRILQLLGQGGFADVYLGEHKDLGTKAAIKVLHTRLSPADLEAFRSEARIIAHLAHPHIIRVLDFDSAGSTPFLVMDYAAGGTMRQRYPRGTCVPLDTVVSTIQQIADALYYAHSQRLIHRDIKPENILLDQRGQTLLSDFGIAVVTHSSRQQSTAENIVGTAAYMAPEQIRGKPLPASDQYALGIIVYEWLSGTRPFHGSFAELCAQHVSSPPPPLREKVPTISPVLEQVVLTALAKDPGQRFENVKAFADALEEQTKQVPTYYPSMASLPSVTPVSEMASVQPPPYTSYTEEQALAPSPLRRRKRAWWIAAVLAFLLVGGLFLQFFITQHSQSLVQPTAASQTQALAANQASASSTSTVAATGASQANASPTATAFVADSCPSSTTVAQAIGVKATMVSSDSTEACDFILAKVTAKVHCPTGYGEVSFQYVSSLNKLSYVRACNGTETTAFHLTEGKVRFVRWEPDGDACTVYDKSWDAYLAQGTTCAVTAPQGSCPTPSEVAQAIGDSASFVSSHIEACGFELQTGSQRTVHCPVGYGKVSFQYALSAGSNQYIRACDGTASTAFQLNGGKVRFVSWESDGDACTVYRKSGGATLAPGTTC